jgi:lipoyl(octanoyl) transferase
MSDRGAVWRLIIDPAQDGFRNMAVDEALLESCRRTPDSDGLFPVLRLYGWSTPTLSLGRFQDALRAVDQGYCRENGVPIVRRPTGGAAVLHDREVTYSLVGTTGRHPFAGSILESYRRIGEGIVRGLATLDLRPDPPAPCASSSRSDSPAQCFARTANYEITFGGKKVVGSAQVRRRGASLQHGSLLLDADAGLFEEATGGQQGERRSWTTLTELMGRRPDFEEVAIAVARGIGEVFGVRWAPGETSVAEERLADGLRARKYLNAHWTARGRSALSRT